MELFLVLLLATQLHALNLGDVLGAVEETFLDCKNADNAIAQTICSTVGPKVNEALKDAKLTIDDGNLVFHQDPVIPGRRYVRNGCNYRLWGEGGRLEVRLTKETNFEFSFPSLSEPLLLVGHIPVSATINIPAAQQTGVGIGYFFGSTCVRSGIDRLEIKGSGTADVSLVSTVSLETTYNDLGGGRFEIKFDPIVTVNPLFESLDDLNVDIDVHGQNGWFNVLASVINWGSSISDFFSLTKWLDGSQTSTNVWKALAMLSPIGWLTPILSAVSLFEKFKDDPDILINIGLTATNVDFVHEFMTNWAENKVHNMAMNQGRTFANDLEKELTAFLKKKLAGLSTSFDLSKIYNTIKWDVNVQNNAAVVSAREITNQVRDYDINNQGWVKCATASKTCSLAGFSGKTVAKYASGGVAKYKSITDTFQCTSEYFGHDNAGQDCFLTSKILPTSGNWDECTSCTFSGQTKRTRICKEKLSNGKKVSSECVFGMYADAFQCDEQLFGRRRQLNDFVEEHDEDALGVMSLFRDLLEEDSMGDSSEEEEEETGWRRLLFSSRRRRRRAPVISFRYKCATQSI